MQFSLRTRYHLPQKQCRHELSPSDSHLPSHSGSLRLAARRQARRTEPSSAGRGRILVLTVTSAVRRPTPAGRTEPYRARPAKIVGQPTLNWLATQASARISSAMTRFPRTTYQRATWPPLMPHARRHLAMRLPMGQGLMRLCPTPRRTCPSETPVPRISLFLQSTRRPAVLLARLFAAASALILRPSAAVPHPIARGPA